MYGRKANGELKQAQLEEARLGFIQFLRRKHLSPQFIASHGDDLFATAALEYSRKLAEGEEIETSAGWLIACAWRRTKSLLEAEGRSPHIVSTDRAEAIKDLGQSPEDVTLDEDRMRKVQEAIGQLSVEERRLLELAYFEGMAVREIARQLHWHSSKAQRCHEAARERLHELLGVSSSDDLQIEIGLAAYVSLAAEASTGGRITRLLQRAGQKSAEGLASLKQQAAATYTRAVDPTPLAGARPGTVAALLVSCVTIGGGAATYCAQNNVDPLSAASGLISGEEDTTTAESTPPPETTPVEPLEPTSPVVEETASSEAAPSTEAEPQPAPDPKPEPEPAPPPPEQSFEPASTSYPATEAESESAAPESSTPERARPAPVSGGGAPQFGGP